VLENEITVFPPKTIEVGNPGGRLGDPTIAGAAVGAEEVPKGATPDVVVGGELDAKWEAVCREESEEMED